MLAFFCALPHDQSQNLINSLETYLEPDAPYIVSLETSLDTLIETSGQHFHCCCSMNLLQYDAFRKTILVNKYKLRGQAKPDKPKQYGKVSSIRDETKMLQYTVKDNNIIYRNYSLETIQELICSSFPKSQHLTTYNKLMKFLTNVQEGPNICEYIIDLEINIINFYRINKINKPLSRTSIQRLTTSFLMYHTKLEDEIIKNYIKN